MFFRDIFASAARAHLIEVDNSSQFYARIKNLQRIGLAPDTNTGRGKMAIYTDKVAADFICVMEICSIGVNPEDAIKMLRANREALHEAYRSRSTITLPGVGFFGKPAASTFTLSFERYGK